MAPSAKIAALAAEQASRGDRDDDRDLDKRMREIERQQEDLGRQQEELGRKQEELGRQQEALGRQQEAASTKAEARMKDLMAKALRSDLAQEVR